MDLVSVQELDILKVPCFPGVLLSHVVVLADRCTESGDRVEFRSRI